MIEMESADKFLENLTGVSFFLSKLLVAFEERFLDCVKLYYIFTNQGKYMIFSIFVSCLVYFLFDKGIRLGM